MVLSRNGKNNEQGGFDWGDALADAGIMAGSTFFLTLAGMGVAGMMTDIKSALLGAVIAAGGQFFAILAVKRGLREKVE